MLKHRCFKAWFVLIVLALLLQSCTSVQQIIQGTPTFTPTLTATPTITITPTRTLTSTPKPTSTPTPNLIATQQYEAFFSLVEQYYDAKLIPSTKGLYRHLQDHSDSVAEVNSLRWSTIGMQAQNFILKSHVKMSASSESSASTGCGFVFRTLGTYTDAIFVQQGGDVSYLTGNTVFHTQHHSSFSNPAEFDLVLIADEALIRVLVDNKEALKYTTFLDPGRGDLGFGLILGHAEIESQCEFTNNELWLIIR